MKNGDKTNIIRMCYSNFPVWLPWKSIHEILDSTCMQTMVRTISTTKQASRDVRTFLSTNYVSRITMDVVILYMSDKWRVTQ